MTPMSHASLYPSSQANVTCFDQWDISNIDIGKGLKKYMYFGVSPLLLLENLLLPYGYTQAIPLKDKTPGGSNHSSHPRHVTIQLKRK